MIPQDRESGIVWLYFEDMCYQMSEMTHSSNIEIAYNMCNARSGRKMCAQLFWMGVFKFKEKSIPQFAGQNPFVDQSFILVSISGILNEKIRLVEIDGCCIPIHDTWHGGFLIIHSMTERMTQHPSPNDIPAVFYPKVTQGHIFVSNWKHIFC